MKRALFCATLMLSMLSTWVGSSHAFCLIPAPGDSTPCPQTGIGWPSNQLTFSTNGFSDSNAIFDNACQQAVNLWSNRANFTFHTVTSAADPCGGPNGSHGWAFGATDCGVEFGALVLAVATSWTQTTFMNGVATTTRTDSDIIFNSAVAWDVHSGAGSARDFRRVAVHELGHAIGIGHDNSQAALMNTHYSDIESPQIDDIAALIALYGTIGGNAEEEDITAPTVTSASWLDATHVLILFDESVNGAITAANYSSPGLTVIAVASQGGNSYRLTTSVIPASSSFVITVSGVTDLAGNSIDPSANSAGFTRPANQSPTLLGTVTISPAAPKVGDKLTIQGLVSDADGDPLTMTYQWQRDGIDMISATEEAYTLGQTDAHATITALLSADDGQGGVIQRATPVVQVQNSLPVATDDTVDLFSLNSVTIHLLDNDSDADGDPLLIQSMDALSANGAVVIDQGHGTALYTPPESPPADVFTDSFTYTIDDGQGGSSTATVMVVVDPTMPALLSNGVHGMIMQQGSTVSVLFSLSAPDPSDTYTFLVSGLSLGHASFQGQTLSLTADAVGQETIMISVVNQNGAKVSMPFVLTVNDPLATDHHAPAPSGDGMTIGQKEDLNLNPESVDSDGDGVDDAFEVGDPGSAWDQDRDGIIDALEAGDGASDASVASGLLLPDGSSLLTLSSSSSSFSAVSSLLLDGSSPADASQNLGKVSFKIVAVNEAPQTIRMLFSATLPLLRGLYQVDPFSNYTLIPPESWRQIDANTIELTLSDGDLLDQDGVVNGRVASSIAFALHAEEAVIAPDQSEASESTGGGGCLLSGIGGWLPGLLLLAIQLLYRRRLGKEQG